MNDTNIAYTHEKINNQRWYNIDGIKYLGVTSALEHITEDKDFYLGWGAKQKFESKEACIRSFWAMMENAGKIGTDAHTAIEMYQSGQEPDLGHEKVKQAFENFLAAEKEKNIAKPLHAEVTLLSKRYGYAGTCDYIGQIGGKLVICDWKTSPIHQFKYGFQVAAYREAAIEMGLVDETCGSSILYLSKTSAYHKLYTHQQHESLFTAFLAALHTFKMINPGVIRGLKDTYPWGWENPIEEFYAHKFGNRPEPQDFDMPDYMKEPKVPSLGRK